jgi:MazG family protein
MADLNGAKNAELRASALDSTQPGIDQLCAIVAFLRSPEGCPWDREQTHATLRPGLIEEAYEVVEAIDRTDDENLREELGDLLLQSVFHAQIASEEGRFSFEEVARGIATKLVRRHPHVFGEDSCEDSAAVLKRWDEIKRAEKAARVASVLDGISAGLPALMRAEKVQKKAARVGFDWSELAPVFEKIREELEEVEGAVAAGDSLAIEDELGDLLFSVANLARKLKVDGETALQRATGKFIARFQKMEALAVTQQLALEKLSLAELDVLWEQVKAGG